jgi:8-oxo-dGTP diphosphatase
VTLQRAAGGLVFRGDPKSGYEILVVHRPKYADWSLPKGKVDPGESDHQTAIREVEEETGVRCRIIENLAQIEYQMGSGRPKLVHFFSMKPMSVVPFHPNDEVDEIRWVTLEEAGKLLSYQDDRWMVSEADYRRLDTSGTLYLVRHAAAGVRVGWAGPDTERPLTEKGRRQAEALVPLLGTAGITRIYASPHVRCKETVEPLAHELALKIRNSKNLAEGANVNRTLRWFSKLAGENAVLCSHGDMIPQFMRRFRDAGVKLHSPHEYLDCRKGSVWAVNYDGGEPVEAVYTPPIKL